MNNPSSRDPNQIIQYTHDESNNSQRVTIVGGDFGIAEAVKTSLKDLKIEFNSSSSDISKEPFIVEKEVIVKEYNVLQVPQIIKEQEIKVIELDKPIIVKETEIKVIEQQVIVKEVKDLDKLIKMLLIAQAITLVIVLIKSFV